MQKFLSKILKKKKIIFILFFLFAAAITVPQIVSAAWYNPFSWGSDIGTALMNGIVIGCFGIPLFITSVVADISGAILGVVISLNKVVPITHADAVNIGWPIVRDLANMLIVMGFVVIGIATAIRFKDYEAKRLLPKLIIVACLVNFSLLICGIIIDGANILTNYFFNSTGGGGIFAQSILNSFNLVKQVWDVPWTTFAITMVAMIVFNFFAFFIYLLYALLLLVRIIALWILVILSPLAFVCYVAPGKRLHGVYDMWWSNFMSWCIIGVPAGLFYYLAVRMINNMTRPDTIKLIPPADSIMNQGFITTMSSNFSLIIPGIFLVVGFFVALQSAPMGASAIMGAAKKYSGSAVKGGLGVLNKAHQATTGRALGAAAGKLGQWGAAMQAKPGAGNKIGSTMLGAASWGARALSNPVAQSQRTRAMVGRGLERMGAQKTGTEAIRAQGEVEASAKLSLAAYISGDPAAKARVENDAVNGTGALRAGALQAIGSEGKLHTVKGFQDAAGNADMAKINAALTDSESFGMSRKVRKSAQDAMPELSAYNEDTIKDIMDTTKTNPATGAAFTRGEAQREAVRRTNANLSIGKLRDMPSSQANENLAEDVDNRTFDRASLEFTTDMIAKLKKLNEVGGANEKRYTALDAEHTRLVAAGKTNEAEQVMHRIDNLVRNMHVIDSWK